MTLFPVDKIISVLNWGFTSLLILSIGFLIFSLFPKLNETPPSFLKRAEKPLRRSLPTHYTFSEGGPFAISSKLRSFPLPDFQKEIQFIHKSTRPDISLSERVFQIGFKKSKETIKTLPGQKTYLTYAAGKGKFTHELKQSDEVTPLWVKPFIAEEGKMMLEVGLRLIGCNREKLLDEKKDIIVDPLIEKEGKEIKATHTPPQFAAAVSELRGCKWWGKDHLFGTYGGEEYGKLAVHERLEFTNSFGIEILYIKEGDSLIWKNGKWTPAVLGDETKNHYLASLKTVSPNKMEWQVWDETGLESISFSLQREKIENLTLSIQECLTGLRQRTSLRVSCRINNKATILKKGDWLIRGATGWHIIKNLREIEEILQLRTRGELLIFDGIEKTNGKSIFLGTIFSPMRTQMQNLKIPISDQKKKADSNPSKKGISSKIQGTSIDEDSSLDKLENSHVVIEKIRPQKKDPILHE